MASGGPKLADLVDPHEKIRLAIIVSTLLFSEIYGEILKGYPTFQKYDFFSKNAKIRDKYFWENLMRKKCKILKGYPTF